MLSRATQVLSTTTLVLPAVRKQLHCPRVIGNCGVMSIQHKNLATPLLAAEDETELARRIEAGLFAEHLLATDQHRGRVDLQAVRLRGGQAWEQMWCANLRLVMKIAAEHARRHVLPVDDLFQEGCVGLAEALQRFDHRRGLRFTTLAHEYVRRAVAASAAQRCGALESSPYRQRIRRLTRDVTGTDDVSLRRAADLIGLPTDVVASSNVQLVPLDEECIARTSTEDVLGPVDGYGTDFLNLLDATSGAVLRLRFGIGCRAHSVPDLARAMRMSPTTVRRLEQQAIERARQVLAQEQCLLLVPAVRALLQAA